MRADGYPTPHFTGGPNGMILVVGATGMLGTEICQALRGRGLPTCAFVRPVSLREAALRAIGAEVRHGDLKDRLSLERACRGVSAVVTTANSASSRRAGDTLRTVDRDGQMALVSAAREAGVDRFVYVSVTPNLSSSTPFVAIKREVERVVRMSGMRWTILQPCKFMEVWLGPPIGWDLEAGKVTVFGGGNTSSSFVSIHDVARVAVEALEREAMASRSIVIGGPQALSELEVVRVFEEATGRPYVVHHVPLPLMRMMSALLRWIDPIKASLMSMGVDAAARGDAVDMSELQRELGFPFTTVREYATRQAAMISRPG